jgi:predicted metal-dependent peptidase
MDELSRIREARTWLMLRHPFFGYLAMYLRFREDPGVGTMGVNSRGEIRYSPEFVRGLGREELAGVLAHEILHLVLGHLDRRGKRCPPLWNLAADAVVDAILAEAGFPPSLWKPLFWELGISPKEAREGWAESLYARLEGRFRPRCGECAPARRACPACGWREGRDEHELDGEGSGEWRGRFFEAYQAARLRGDVPGEVERIYRLLSRGPLLDWRSLLWRYVSRSLPVDFTWLRPSTRGLHLGVYLPSVRRESLECVVAVDTSGSISREELSEFMTEVAHLLRSLEGVEAWLLCCDCEVHAAYRLDGGFDPSLVRLRGGGGTSHRPVFEWIRRERPGTQLAICLTDGESEFPERQPVPNVIWVVSREGNPDRIPWGTKVRMG